MNLHCFNCGYEFKEKKEIFRTSLNYPFCEECFYDWLLDEWDDDYIESVITEIKENFNGNYTRWKKKFFETMERCDGCSGKYYDNMYYPKEDLSEINGKNYCESCIELIELGGSSND